MTDRPDDALRRVATAPPTAPDRIDALATDNDSDRQDIADAVDALRRANFHHTADLLGRLRRERNIAAAERDQAVAELAEARRLARIGFRDAALDALRGTHDG